MDDNKVLPFDEKGRLSAIRTLQTRCLAIEARIGDVEAILEDFRYDLVEQRNTSNAQFDRLKELLDTLRNELAQLRADLKFEMEP